MGGLNFISVKGPELFSKWVGESEKAVAETFRKARMAAPCVIFFDEIDALGGSRGRGALGVEDRVLGQLLSEMDGMKDNAHIIVIGATNRPDMLDAALLRPGRFDRVLYVAPPDHDTRKQIIDIQLKRIPHSPSISVDSLAEKTAGFSGAEVATICKEASMLALEEDLNAQQVTDHHFQRALKDARPQITREMLKYFEGFHRKFNSI